MKNKIIIAVLILSMIALIFSSCGGGGNPVIPPDDTEDSDIPEPTESISQEIDLSIGGTIEVTDEESPIYGVKLIIPPMPSKREGKALIANIAISYLSNPYAVELPDNQGFLRSPLTISSDITLDTDCILEIPYTEDDLSNAGASSNETVNVYRYSYTSSSWEKITINKKIQKDTSDIIEIIFRPEDTDSPYACTILDAYPPTDLGLPQPGDLLYKLGTILDLEKKPDGWRPGHVGIYVGERYDEKEKKHYNVIEALSAGVQRSYYNPISDFSGSATYMGARQPESGALTSGINGQRDIIVDWAEGMMGLPYAWGQSIGVLWGMLKGDLVKGDYGTFNCVGLAEKAYEIAGINNFEGLVSDWAEGNSSLCILPTCVLTPAEQYNKTVPAEGYNVSGKVSDSQGNGISGVTLNFELVSFNDYHDSFELITNSGGYWSSDKLGREWNVTPQEDGYTFEPSSRKVKENANDVDFTGTLVTLETYTITASAGSNGSISPSGNISVSQGSDKSFTITPDAGYSINDILVDGSSVGAVSSYTFINVTEDHTISATFQETLHSDLVITDLYIEPDPPVAGGNYSIGVDIKNQGDENIEETFQAKVYFDDEYIEQFEIEGLGVGHMLRILTTSYFTWPSDTNSHTIKAIVDPNNIINESNENNNQYSNSFISSSITPASVIMEEFNGNTIGNSYGIIYTNTINGQGAVFSRVKESRIEYPFSIGFPHEGTVEYLIKVYNGYRYSDYVLNDNSDCARIFDTGSQDVWYPGAIWIDVCDNGTINLGTATAWAQPECHNLKATGTDFTFNEWHTIGFSFGSQGQYIMLDGNIVAANASYTESLQTCGNFTSAVNVPTVGELVSCFWVNNRHDAGFEGVIDRFRISEKQKDWYLSKESPLQDKEIGSHLYY